MRLRRPGWLFRTQTFEQLRGSLYLHVQRPLILVVVIGGALMQFGLEMWAGFDAPGPADLAGKFGVPPIDSFALLKGSVGVVPLGMILLIRLAVVWLFVCLVLQIAPAKDNLLRTGGAFLFSLFVFGVLWSALAWFGPFFAGGISRFLEGPAGGDPYLAGPRLALGIVFYFVFVPLLLLAAAVISPLVGRAAAGQGLKPRLKHGCVWLLVFFSDLLYLPAAFGGQEGGQLSSGSFVGAFVLLSLQSVILAAIVRATAGSAALRTLAE